MSEEAKAVIVEEEQVEEQQEEQLEADDSSDDSDEDRLQKHDSGVQKRINELTRKWREEERARVSAYNYAQQLKKENDDLKNKYNSLDTGYQKEYEARITSQFNDAKTLYKSAHESGDVDKMVEAQSLISQLSIEKERLRLAKQQAESAAAASAAAPTNQPILQNYQQPRTVQPDEKALQWAEKNKWFGEDRVMTNGAKAIHEDLVNEGFDPKSDEYYTEIDKRLKENFPQKFTKQRASQTVAGASRISTGAKGKEVRLSPSEVAMAKKLNVPLEEYAKFVKR